MADQTSRIDPRRVASVIDVSTMQDLAYPTSVAGVAFPTLLIQDETDAYEHEVLAYLEALR